MATERKAPIGKKRAKQTKQKQPDRAKQQPDRASTPRAPAPAPQKRAAGAPAPLPPIISDMAIEWVPLSTVTAYGRNPRIISDRAIAKVQLSLERFGWRQPLVVDKDRVVIVGHTRLMAAARMGLAKVPIHMAHNLSKNQAKAYRLMDNRSGQESQWDAALAGEEISALEQDGFDLDDTGFDGFELNQMRGEGGSNDADDEWDGMPEYEHTNQSGVRLIVMHFVDEAAVELFAKLINKEISPKIKYLWFPDQARVALKEKRYSARL